MSQYTIGIDLGGTTMTAGLVDETYHIVAKLTWATRLPPRQRVQWYRSLLLNYLSRT